jgi:RNA polymerase primary sigma factor
MSNRYSRGSTTNRAGNGLDDASASRARSARSRGDAPESSLPVYLREMGAVPRIDAAEEVRLSRAIERSRKALGRLARQMPAARRDHVLQGAAPKKTGDWSFERIDGFCERLTRGADLFADLRPFLSVVRTEKRRLDEAREALILANLRLVVFMAKRYSDSSLSLNDLIQEGNLGLIKAVEKFDYSLGNKFSTYAYWWIKQAIDRAIAEKSRTIRLPVHLSEKRRKLFRLAGQLQRRLGRRPSVSELAEQMETTVERVEELLSVVQDSQAFEDLATPEGLDPRQIIEDPNSAQPLQLAQDHELRRRVESSMRLLDMREEEIIRLRFGIGRDSAHTLVEVGRLVSLSRERVRQIEMLALRKLLASDLLTGLA